MKLEHNVHEQPGNMPNLQAEHWSEHSEAFQDFTNSDSPNVRADESTERTHMRHSGHRSSGISHTGNPLGIGHTGNRSDHEHSVPRSRSIRSDAFEHRSYRTRHHSDVSRYSWRDSNTHRNTFSLRHADPGEHSPASMIRHCHARSCSRSYALSLREVIVVSPLIREGRRRSLIRRGSTLPLLVLLLAALSLLPLEKEKENGTSLKEEEETL